MEYLQYLQFLLGSVLGVDVGFKPYYKWNTFNTVYNKACELFEHAVLNLIINGIPSIHNGRFINTIYSS